jgi:hypothetical protein
MRSAGAQVRRGGGTPRLQMEARRVFERAVQTAVVVETGSRTAFGDLPDGLYDMRRGRQAPFRYVLRRADELAAVGIPVTIRVTIGGSVAEYTRRPTRGAGVIARILPSDELETVAIPQAAA